jgi:hypothetical protein
MTLSHDEAGPPAHSAVEAVRRAGPREADTRDSAGSPAKRRGRGRPLQMTRQVVVEKIRQLADREDGLFRVHLTHGKVARPRFGMAAAETPCPATRSYGGTIDQDEES